jgi:hypothetical protein
VRCLYVDLDGTLLGAAGAVTRDGEGGFTLLGIRALEACHRAGVLVFDPQGRNQKVFASGIRAGVQKGFNEQGAVLTDRFYAGGGTTVRGFRQDELGPKLSSGQPAGGNAVLVLNEELRYPLFWIFDAVSFVDVGNVFPRVSDFKLSELRSTGGPELFPFTISKVREPLSPTAPMA